MPERGASKQPRLFLLERREGIPIVTQRKIFWFWLPLAASWALMTLESPTIQAAIARLPDVKTMLAAAGIVISLEVTIESPVIMLLATSTALAKTPQAYRMLRRFVLHLTILLTVVAAAIAFVDPIYNGLVSGLMGIPGHIAEAAQPGMQVMTFWTMAIGWRRFYQGILIRFGQTRAVGYGTALRLVSSGVTAFSLAVFSDLPGVMVGACTWMAGVVSELIFAYLAVRPTVRDHLSGPDDPNQPGLTTWEIVKYHTPLGATSLLMLLTHPLIGTGLARMAFPEENLAAWPVIFSIFLFFRSAGFALPEVVIARLDSAEAIAPLRQFCLRVAVGSTLLMALVTATPLLSLYVRYVLGVTPELVRFILPGALLGLLIPGLQAIQSWFWGVLMAGKVTNEVYWGMGLNLGVVALTVGAGVLLEAPGVSAAVVALSLGLIAETIFLWWRVRPVQARMQLAPNPTVI